MPDPAPNIGGRKFTASVPSIAILMVSSETSAALNALKMFVLMPTPFNPVIGVVVSNV